MQNLIDGRWRPGSSGTSTGDVNPADTADVIGDFVAATPEDIDDAIAAARRASESWRAWPVVDRGRLLGRAARLVEARCEAIARDLTREEGKTLGEAVAEVKRAVSVLDFYAGLAWGPDGTRHPSERPSFNLETRREALGVVAAITPWNFPVAIPCWKLAPALLCGNAVVLKPSTLTPLAAVNLVTALEEAGLPAGVLGLLLGPGEVIGTKLAGHPGVDAVTFTGSTESGRMIYDVASRAYKRAQTEMGGHNAMVVLADAHLDEAVAIVLDGAFAQAGQRCTATRRAIIEAPLYDAFVERLVERAAGLRVGDPMDPSTDVGPMVSQPQRRLADDGVAAARAEGGQILCGGTVLDDAGHQCGHYYPPTVVAGLAPDATLACHEVFGPILSVFRADGLRHATALANSTTYGLSAGICTQDLDKAEWFVNHSESGVVTVNSATAGMEVQVPIHGRKGSGLGMPEQGSLALDFCSEVKTVYVRHSSQ